MKRRGVLKLFPGLAAAGLVNGGCHPRPEQKLTVFIVSDAHMGWAHASQPSIEEQKSAISVIKKRFPKIDLWIDTGDAHHGNLRGPDRHAARLAWLDTVANALDTAPLLYVPGNHELSRGQNDPEVTAGQLGSLCYRPYYSFTLKGIHFVSLPQLLETIYITQETLDWLALDLALHQHHSVIVLSHNAITGTTYDDGATAYRRTINSQEVLDVLATHPQVLAWLHGHNHTYEINRRDGRLYVSNGRVGGFTPPDDWGSFGQGHLGGVYVELDKTGLRVRCFSATANRFFDEIGQGHLSDSINASTSFNATAEASLGFGHGRQWGSVSTELSQHYLAAQPRGLSVVDNLKHSFVNENPDLNYPKELTYANRSTKKVIGLKVKGPKKRWSANSSQIQFEGGAFEVFFPHALGNENLVIRGPYYSLLPGLQYRFACRWRPSAPEQLAADVSLFDANGPLGVVTAQRHENHFVFLVPEHPTSVFGVIRVAMTIEGAPSVLDRVELTPVATNSDHQAASLWAHGQTICTSDDEMPKPFTGQLTQVELIGAQTQLHRWHIEQEGLRWQVRNAVIVQRIGQQVTLQSTKLAAGGTDIVCAPIGRNESIYAKRIRHATRVYLNLPEPNRKIALQLKFEKSAAPVALVVANANQVGSVHGGQIVDVIDGDMHIRCTSSTVSVLPIEA